MCTLFTAGAAPVFVSCCFFLLLRMQNDVFVNIFIRGDLFQNDFFNESRKLHPTIPCAPIQTNVVEIGVISLSMRGLPRSRGGQSHSIHSFY